MNGEFTAAEIAVIFAVYLGAATGKGITGLGFSTTCLPFLALTVGIEDALGLIIIPSVSANIIVQVSVGHFGVTLRRFWPMLLATLPGLVLGLAVLDAVDADIAAGALGGVLLLYCAFAFVRRDVRLRPTLESPLP